MPARYSDHVPISVSAGHGGAGAVHFHRARFRPKLGPDGGSGGRGGDVVIQADPRLPSLGHLQAVRCYRAKDGEPGSAQKKRGRRGEEHILTVPVGTRVFAACDHDDGGEAQLLGEILAPGDTITVATGGRGGMGNASFVTPTRQAPRIATPGTAGDKRQLILRWHAPGDWAVLGLPNVGKTTVFRLLTGHPVLPAAHPFATRQATLGAIPSADEREEPLTAIDLPALAAGSGEGRGLGSRFLQHLLRPRGQIWVLGAGAEHPPLGEQLRILEDELGGFPGGFGERPRAIVINRFDDGELNAGEISGFAAQAPLITLDAQAGPHELRDWLFDAHRRLGL